jgi:putative transposase
MKTRFNETQILQILKEYEAGKTANELSREHGISKSTINNWQSKYSGMTASDIRRLKHLEEENSKLKRMYADVCLENTAIKDLLTKKW